MILLTVSSSLLKLITAMSRPFTGVSSIPPEPYLRALLGRLREVDLIPRVHELLRRLGRDPVHWLSRKLTRTIDFVPSEVPLRPGTFCSRRLRSVARHLPVDDLVGVDAVGYLRYATGVVAPRWT